MTLSILDSTEMDITVAHAAATEAGQDAAAACIQKHYGGSDMGACGFAWVTFYPDNKGNTKLGKQERKMVEAIGFRKDYTGKAWQLWNPSQYHGQNVDAKFQGAQAYAEKFKEMTGVKLYAGDRLD